MTSIEYYEGLRAKEQERKAMHDVATKKLAEALATDRECKESQQEYELHLKLQSSNRFQ
jgi:hypothetical protein